MQHALFIKSFLWMFSELTFGIGWLIGVLFPREDYFHFQDLLGACSSFYSVETAWALFYSLEHVCCCCPC